MERGISVFIWKKIRKQESWQKPTLFFALKQAKVALYGNEWEEIKSQKTGNIWVYIDINTLYTVYLY